MDKKWVEKVAPWLRIVLEIAAALDPTKMLQAVNSEFPILKQSEQM